jgi:hypothetical protein
MSSRVMGGLFCLRLRPQPLKLRHYNQAYKWLPCNPSDSDGFCRERFPELVDKRVAVPDWR